MQNTEFLFQKAKLGNTEVKNRLSVAPMTRISATSEGIITDRMVSYYTSFAKGGFGLILTEGTYIDDKYSQTYFDQPGIAYDEQAEAWKKVVDSVHQEGAKIFMQLQHSGPLSQGNRFAGETVAPSAVQPKGEQLTFYLGEGPFSMPREVTKEEINDIIKSFVSAAQRAKSAGFDGVEIHGANGYLLDAFLTEYTNQRTDEYGGSSANRVRLLVEVAKAIREAVGEVFTVGIRISQSKVNDYTYKWSGKEEDAKIIFSQLGQAGLDYIHVTEYEAWQPAFDSSDITLIELAKKYANVAIIANGQLDDISRAEDIVKSMGADVVALGKGALANHDWFKKVRNGEALNVFEAEKVLRPTAKLKDFEL
ncbi:NADH:flavin oxidoreductase [Virgibacillus sp. 7505]|uniref:NADH:flavin oxidoreductase n=1 Tax=Virgibacillus sp. 7505 TaxID=2022548 RepID=UPI000BA53565|nr:NADH:flavin oxidoreductase [Virgibacillus sp. 7505]PAE15947.1 NADH:flavin oxidoreductase [Virgibacillus sp. 7505]